MDKILERIKQLLVNKNKRGQGIIEYGFILSFIALAVIVALGVLGTKVASFFTTFADMF